MKNLILEIKSKRIRIKSLYTNTANLIIKDLPITSNVQKWGEEIFFNTNLSIPLEKDAKEIINFGEIAFWTEGSAIAIGYGRTPASKGDEIRLVSPCNIWGNASFNKGFFKNVYEGDEIKLYLD